MIGPSPKTTSLWGQWLDWRKALWQKNRIAGRDMRSCHVNGPNSAAKKQQAKLAAILRFFGADRLAGA